MPYASYALWHHVACAKVPLESVISAEMAPFSQMTQGSHLGNLRRGAEVQVEGGEARNFVLCIVSKASSASQPTSLLCIITSYSTTSTVTNPNGASAGLRLAAGRHPLGRGEGLANLTSPRRHRTQIKRNLLERWHLLLLSMR